jgi:hypothetical protein
MDKTEDVRLLTRNEAMKELDISKRLFKKIEKGLPFVAIGESKRYTIKGLQRWIENNTRYTSETECGKSDLQPPLKEKTYSLENLSAQETAMKPLRLRMREQRKSMRIASLSSIKIN